MIGVAAGLAGSAWRDPGYESTGTAFVAFEFPPDVQDPFSGLQFVTQRIDSYAELGQSRVVLQKAADDVGTRSEADLADNVRVSAVPGTVLLRVTVEDEDRVTSIRVADSVMAQLDSSIGAVESGGPQADSPVRVVPIQPAIPGRASTLLADVAWAGAGLLLGAALGAIAAMTTLMGGGRPGRGRRTSQDPGHRDDNADTISRSLPSEGGDAIPAHPADSPTPEPAR